MTNFAQTLIIESLQAEIKDLKQLVQSLGTLFKACLKERETMVSHIASATSGFWEISAPYSKISFIRNAQSFSINHSAENKDMGDYFPLSSEEKVRLSNRLEKIKNEPINYFEYTLRMGKNPIRLQGRCVEWDADGLPAKLIGIYVELPKDETSELNSKKTVLVCSQCRQFKGGDLEWDILEDAMPSRFGVKVSFGLCPHCATEHM